MTNIMPATINPLNEFAVAIVAEKALRKLRIARCAVWKNMRHATGAGRTTINRRVRHTRTAELRKIVGHNPATSSNANMGWRSVVLEQLADLMTLDGWCRRWTLVGTWLSGGKCLVATDVLAVLERAMD